MEIGVSVLSGFVRNRSKPVWSVPVVDQRTSSEVVLKGVTDVIVGIAGGVLEPVIYVTGKE
jgi:hypothetical protein